MKEYRVMCSSMSATYSAGRYVANTAEEACQMAREEYQNSSLGKQLKDVGAFRFYTVSKFPYEDDSE